LTPFIFGINIQHCLQTERLGTKLGDIAFFVAQLAASVCSPTYGNMKLRLPPSC